MCSLGRRRCGRELSFNPPAPGGFSGNLTITIEVITINAHNLEVSTGEMLVVLYFHPVPDPVPIGMSDLTGKEDEEMPLPITLVTKQLRDVHRHTIMARR
jgi:hypothetical protein